jgi:hypothetical protein
MKEQKRSAELLTNLIPGSKLIDRRNDNHGGFLRKAVMVTWRRCEARHPAIVDFTGIYCKRSEYKMISVWQCG